MIFHHLEVRKLAPHLPHAAEGSTGIPLLTSHITQLFCMGKPRMKWLLLSIFALALSGCGKAADGDIGVTAPVTGTRVIVTNPQQRSIDYSLTALGTVESIHNPTISAGNIGTTCRY